MAEKMVKASLGQHTDPKPARYPHFVKIILQSAIEDKKMIIPPKFVMLFGDTLSDTAELALLDGCIWPVGLKKESKSICFDKNWHEFVQLHSIRQGYVLLFSYKGASQFNVRIFDYSYCEYHNHRKPVASLMLTKHDLKQENLFENGDKKSIVVFDRNEGMEEINASEDVRSKRAKVFLETNGAIESANMFNPPKPSFTVVLKSYNIDKYVYVKARFSTTYLRGVSDSIRVENPEGRGWMVKVIRKLNNSLMLTSGWTAFVRDNHLQQGDICVFEIIKRNNATFRVSMHRQSPFLPSLRSNKQYMIAATPEEMKNPKKEKEKQVNLKKKRKITNGPNQDSARYLPEFAKAVSTASASSGVTPNPSFMIVLKSYNSNPPLVRVLNSFAKKYLRRDCDEITVKDPVGREWKLKLGWGVNSNQGPYLNGWHKVAKANCFKAGDVCNFQYVNANGMEPFLKVSVCDES